MKACYNASESILKSLDRMLENDDLTYEEKMKIIEKMQEIQQMINEKDTENKKFIRDIVSIAGLVVVAIVGASATLLGGDLKLPKNKE